MGLSISGYNKVKIVDRIVDPDIDYPLFYTEYNSYFIYQLGTLRKNSIYMMSDLSEKYSFSIGSYSFYNKWRNDLAIMAGYMDAKNVWNDKSFKPNNLRLIKLNKINNKEIIIKPFYELIKFSDCEGLIGNIVCKKLYQDFVDFDDAAKIFGDRLPYFYDKYCNLKEVFRFASDDGLVYFH